jgi:asparagine synthase (glutamine-hydrolysing)
MCGIAGYFNLSLAATERVPLLNRMCQAMIHRGPDDDGYYADEWAGLGICRLSIIDLATGHQPISTEDRKKQIIFNGEIFNYRELRAQLQQQGYRFTTGSDTEAILHQYEKDGEACVQHFNGMFAFAIWDAEKRRLFLARDRVGVKPFYYFWDGKHLIFASEIKSILASGYVQRKLNRQALWDYLTFRYVPQPETIWQNVHKLLPGHTLTISFDRPEPNVARYWDIPYGDSPVRREAEELDHEFAELFIDAVRLRLIADVPVGILLSGGLDSSAVAAAVAELHEGGLGSFSVAFQDSPQINELPFARKMANYVGTDHNEVVIGEREFCEFLPDFVRLTDEPLADLASVPLYFVSRLARQKVKVVLSGEGSDEVLAGYDFDRLVREWDCRRRYQQLPKLLRGRTGLAALRRLYGARFDDLFMVSDVPLDLRFHSVPPHMTNYLTTEEKRELFPDGGCWCDSMDIVRAAIQRTRTREPLHQMLYAYCQSWLVEDLLMKADRMSMANSIELRTPFLDYRLLEWAAQAPTTVKVAKDKENRYETKHVLRRFARTRVPPEIIRREKMGFPVPVYDWLTNCLKTWAISMLSSPETQLNRWLDRDGVMRQVRAGTAPEGTMQDKHRLWNLLILELWSREWKPE